MQREASPTALRASQLLLRRCQEVGVRFHPVVHHRHMSALFSRGYTWSEPGSRAPACLPWDHEPMTADPLDAGTGVPFDLFVELRRRCPVTQTPSGAYFLARYADVLAATKNIDVFQASFREPG